MSESFFSMTPGEVATGLTFNIKMILAFSFTILLLCVIMSSFGSVSDRRYNCHCNDTVCTCSNMEQFSDDNLYSYSLAPEADSQSVSLYSNDNLLVGETIRFITPKEYILTIKANLYTIGGNVFDKSPVGNYNVILSSTNDPKIQPINLGSLKIDGDQYYKMVYRSPDIQKMLNYNKISIVYTISDKQQEIVSGKLI